MKIADFQCPDSGQPVIVELTEDMDDLFTVSVKPDMGTIEFDGKTVEQATQLWVDRVKDWFDEDSFSLGEIETTLACVFHVESNDLDSLFWD